MPNRGQRHRGARPSFAYVESAPPFGRCSRESGSPGRQRSVACPGSPLSRMAVRGKRPCRKKIYSEAVRSVRRSPCQLRMKGNDGGKRRGCGHSGRVGAEHPLIPILFPSSPFIQCRRATPKQARMRVSPNSLPHCKSFFRFAPLQADDFPRTALRFRGEGGVVWFHLFGICSRRSSPPAGSGRRLRADGPTV